MNRTWKPIVAGIFAIATGCFKLLAVLGLIIAIIAIRAEAHHYVNEVDPVDILLAIAIPLGILGILSIVGGAFALQRKSWGMALTGSIASLMPFSILGLVALILTALSRDEFE